VLLGDVGSSTSACSTAGKCTSTPGVACTPQCHCLMWMTKADAVCPRSSPIYHVTHSTTHLPMSSPCAGMWRGVGAARAAAARADACWEASAAALHANSVRSWGGHDMLRSSANTYVDTQASGRDQQHHAHANTYVVCLSCQRAHADIRAATYMMPDGAVTGCREAAADKTLGSHT
jgi:hypothetical protein